MKIFSLGVNYSGASFSGVRPVFVNRTKNFNYSIQKDTVNFTGATVLREIDEKYLEKNREGRVPVFYADARKTAEINAELKDKPDILSKMYLTEDVEGRLPAHYADAKKLSEINEALKDDPETLVNMYLRTDCIGAIPAEFYGAEELKTMNEALKEDPDALATAYILISRTVPGIPSLDSAENASRQEFIIQSVKELSKNGELGIEQYVRLSMAYERYGLRLN